MRSPYRFSIKNYSRENVSSRAEIRLKLSWECDHNKKKRNGVMIINSIVNDDPEINSIPQRLHYELVQECKGVELQQVVIKELKESQHHPSC